MRKRKIGSGIVLAMIVVLGTAHARNQEPAATKANVKKSPPAQAEGGSIPQFQVDPWWPKAMPNDYFLGQLGGVAVDDHDNVWIASRPRTIAPGSMGEFLKPPTALCCNPAPAVIEFDAAGNFVRGWGAGAGYQFPANPHGIKVDYKGNVWVGGNASPSPNPKQPQDQDTHIVKFSGTGKFLLQIGKANTTHGSLDTENLNRATQIFVWPKTNEAFVSDGYGNRRVIVFDADTGKFKRMWGAYGNKPDDSVKQERSFNGNKPPQFNLVHGVVISNDGIVYVSDRVNNRIQTFTPDGKYLNEVYINRETLDGRGTSFNIAFSPAPEQKYIYSVDGSSDRIMILDRKSLQVIGWFGRGGEAAGQWLWLHSIASVSKGNIYTGESQGNRVQKFVYKGMGTAQGVNAYRPN